MVKLLASARPPSSLIRKMALLGSALLVTMGAGCRGPAVMHGVFNQYSAAYAEMSNEQMLINLARSANSHPVYFLQMGGINASFQFGANGGSQVGQNRARASGGALASMPGLTDAITLGGNVGVNVGEQPNFNFTPLSGSAFAAALFNPIDPKVFFNLFEQGWPADQLFRVMVQSVTLNDGGTSRTFVNIIDVERRFNYRNFLTLAGIAREFQKRQLLHATPDRTAFTLSDRAFPFMAQLQKDPAYRYEVEADEAPAGTGAVDTKKAGISLQLRTFEGVLNALAREGLVFDYLKAKEGNSFLDNIPPSQRKPVLRIRPEKDKKLGLPVAQVSYRGERYVIADETVDDPATQWEEVSTWNRDVFNLLNKLYVQIAMDPSKLPMQQLIQVH